MEDKKKVNPPSELEDEALGQVAGGVVIPPPMVEEAAYWVTATAECQKCHHSFTYQYHYSEGGIPNGPWSYPAPDFCPDCDPNAEIER